MRRRIIAAALWLGAMTLLGGCGSLPDGKPFADASNALLSSVKSSGNAVEDALGDAATASPGDKAAYEALEGKFAKAWERRIAMTQAAARYSEAIADEIAAGNSGGETAGRVADSLKALAEGVNIPVAAPAVGVAGDLARFIFARVAIVKASQSLESAVTQAQPAIDRIAQQIVDDSDRQLKGLLLDLYKNTVSGIKEPYDRDDSFAQQAARRREAQRQLALKDPSALAKLEQYDRVQASVADSLQERDRKLAAAAAAYRTRLRLVNAMSHATLTWAQAHRDLAAAIQQKRKVDASELQSTIVELRALARKVGEL
ncbi:hypothetical protein [Variovorax sp. OV329]|uniref:hypothetical protein n=1 Tax=Variovorax sp. OV329 TaxID=1882825 RepID=UPI0008E10C3E|nr:hypothetical protein [Variovorax sp. OV329]SFM56802.1 hypothetical protein SAMN05444747_106252 [Variovorax sp. OV329]